MFAYVLFTLECGPAGSCFDAADGSSWIRMEPIKLEESFGQKRGEVKAARPSMWESYV
jgi:hypothetical protein